MCFFKQYRVKQLTKKILKLKMARLDNAASAHAIQKEIKFYHKLYHLYQKLEGHKAFPFAREQSLMMLRFASQLDDAKAQYFLGQALLEEAKWRDQLEKNQVFSHVENKQLIQPLYDTARTILTKAAVRQSLAKRLLGTIYVFGFGVAANQDKGLALIMESIVEEKSWKKMPRILKSLGLDKPEFYTALLKQKDLSLDQG